MAENFDLIFGSSASQSYSWNDSDYQNGWQTVGDTPPTREQFDALQRRADLKAQELNNRLAPIEENDTHDYRQPSTAYTAGQIKYHATLPTGWYLECTTGGTTGSGALTISSPTIGGTVSDGTVVWTLRAESQNLKASMGIVSVDFNRYTEQGIYRIYLDSTGDVLNNPGVRYGILIVYKEGDYIHQSVFEEGLNNFYTRSGNSNTSAWHNWQKVAYTNEIVSSVNLGGYVGYIKFGALLGGLIIQYGLANTANPGPYSFPISFSAIPGMAILRHTTNNERWAVLGSLTETNYSIITNDVTDKNVAWIAVGC